MSHGNLDIFSQVGFVFYMEFIIIMRWHFYYLSDDIIIIKLCHVTTSNLTSASIGVASLPCVMPELCNARNPRQAH